MLKTYIDVVYPYGPHMSSFSMFLSWLFCFLSEKLRWVYEGVIDDPYSEFFIAENKSLQKVCCLLSQ